jgi:hypothetical protein
MIEAPLQLAASRVFEAALAFAWHLARAGKALFRDKRTPRWIRPLVVIAVAPVPGFLDELVGVLVLAVLFAAYRPLVRDVWERSR